jgi:ribulose-phosphate 3-epimerase
MTPPKILIAPSILSADFGRINEEIASVERFSDLIHVDVMDGHFVPNITFGPGQIGKMRSKKPFDVHLMIEHPEKYLRQFVEGVKKAVGEELAAQSYLVVHAEAAEDIVAVVRAIHDFGMKAGVALNPDTPASVLEGVLDEVDMVLCMTVNPGFGGQQFIDSVMSKVANLRSRKPELNIEVDGGINGETVKLAREAGANVFVAGNYVFGAADREAALESLRV